MLEPSGDLHKPFGTNPDSSGQRLAEVMDFLVFGLFVLMMFVDSSAPRNVSQGILELLEASL